MLFEHHTKRRDYVQILHDVLIVCVKPVKATIIARRANMQYSHLNSIVEKLVSNGLLDNQILPPRRKDQRTRRLFQATKSGLKWCEDVEDIYNRIEESMTNNATEGKE